MKLFTILLPLIYTCEYVYICAYVYKSLDCSSYVAIRSGFRVSNRVLVIHGFGFGHEFSPESVFGSVSGFKFGFQFWVPRHSTRSEPDPLPSLIEAKSWCLVGEPPRGRVGLFTPGRLASSPSSLGSSWSARVLA
jgi:hypothetical protein